jgi:hypothetical protein
MVSMSRRQLTKGLQGWREALVWALEATSDKYRVDKSY